jgi:hypothetical protein
MKNANNKLTYGEFFSLEQTQWSSHGYGHLVSIKDLRGDTHKCYCIDKATAKLISSLPKRKSYLDWTVFRSSPAPMRACRGRLTVYETEHGFLARWWFRSNGELREFILANQLNSAPIIFPSLEFGKAAAELCFPRPNRKLGYMWWTYPCIVF